jgi:hypothetical protein
MGRMAAGDQDAVFGLDGAQADLHRKLAAVALEGEELRAAAHAAHLGLDHALAAEALGQQHSRRAGPPGFAASSRTWFRSASYLHNVAVDVDDDHGVRRGFQQAVEFVFRPLARGDVSEFVFLGADQMLLGLQEALPTTPITRSASVSSRVERSELIGRLSVGLDQVGQRAAAKRTQAAKKVLETLAVLA